MNDIALYNSTDKEVMAVGFFFNIWDIIFQNVRKATINTNVFLQNYFILRSMSAQLTYLLRMVWYF